MSTVGAAPVGPGSRPGEASTAVAHISVSTSPLLAASSTVSRESLPPYVFSGFMGA